MRIAIGLLLLSGCSLALNNDDLRFGDAGADGAIDADASADAGVDSDAMAPSCILDEDCPTPQGRLSECRDGACIDLGCAAGRADCDTVPGNGCEVGLQTSLQHCGACREVCSFTGAAGVCSAGVCTIGECREGFANCNTDTGDGCEADLSLPAACGGCDSVCPDGNPVCDSTRDPFACVADCGENTLCDLTCADLDSSLEHCGACDRACPDVAGASPECLDGECGFACSTAFGDCNMDDSDGCEASLQTDLLNCGACGDACDVPNTVSMCTAGSCGIAACEGSFLDCDDEVTNGCESNVATSLDHCGGCNNVCDGPCVDGVCDPVVGGDGGASATCVVRASGAVECWGENGSAQILGLRVFEDGGPTSIQRVDDVPLLATSVTLGNAAMCALDASGKAWCWGTGDFGQLGHGSFDDAFRAVRVTGSDEFNALTLSSVQTHGRVVCALATDNTVWCWGRNSDFGGRMVPGAAADRLANPVRANVPAMRAIGVGSHHVCGVTMSEEVMCWGNGTAGELGDGGATNSGVPVSADAPGFGEVLELSMQASSTCARTRAGELWCWGDNASGELALGDRVQRDIPTLVALDNVRELAAANNTACARTDAGLYCWGRFNSGAVGLPGQIGAVESPTRIDVPAANPELNGATALIAGDTHMCALVDGRPHCWGANDRGQLGTTTSMTYFTPTESGLENVADVAVGSNFGCALTDDGFVYCWGIESTGRIGRSLGGSLATATPGLLRMPLDNVTSIAAGTAHACSAHEGIVSCWGGGNAANRVLGVVSPLSSMDPVQVPLPALGAGDVWVEVSAGVFHSCARSMTGRVACWGDNTRNELGRADTSAREPGFASGLTDAEALKLGQYRSYALLSSGEVVQWGQGVSSSGPAPRTVMADGAPLGDVVALSAGRFHACAISDSDGGGGNVYCWGNDNSGQLGLAVPDGRDEAVAIPGLDDAVAISAGHFHGCAARASGEVLCWGNGVAGQTGDASRPDVALPSVVAGVQATALFGGHNNAHRTFALRDDGALVCWGNNPFGSCGAGEALYIPEAAEVLGL